jgi:hypothetical protein
MNRVAFRLGQDVAHDAGAFQELSPQLVSSQGLLWNFGRGLSRSADDPAAMWDALIAQFAETPEPSCNTQVLCGFLEGLSSRDRALANALLDQAVTQKALAAWFPELQRGITVDEQGLQRLHQSLTLNKAPMWRFRYLAMGRATDSIAGPDLKALIVAMASKPDGGLDAATEILYMRLFSDRQEKRTIDPALIEAGRELVAAFEFTNGRQEGDRRIPSLVKACLSGADGAKGVEALCRKLKDAVAKHEASAFAHHKLLNSLFKAQPSVALQAFFGGDGPDQNRGCQIILEVSHHHANPLDFVPLDVVVAWSERDPGERFPVMARVVTLFNQVGGQIEWSVAALAILDRAPDRPAVLKRFVRRLRPMTWSGSLAAAMETRLPLLRKLETHEDLEIAAFAKSDVAHLTKEIELQREQETRNDKENDERFE